MRELRGLAADHPSRVEAAALTWPVRGLLAGTRRGLAAGVLLIVGLAVTGAWWPATAPLGRAVAATVGIVLVLFAARVLVPAGRLPWRCLSLLPAAGRADG